MRDNTMDFVNLQTTLACTTMPLAHFTAGQDSSSISSSSNSAQSEDTD